MHSRSGLNSSRQQSPKVRLVLALAFIFVALLSTATAHAASAPSTIGISQSFRDFGLKVPGSYDATKDITKSSSLAGLGINTYRVIVPWDLAMRQPSNGRRQEFENWLARVKAKGGSPYVVFGPTEEATNLVDSSHPTRRTKPTGLIAPYPADFKTAIHRFLELWGPQGSSSIGPPVRLIAPWNEPNLAQLEMQLPGHLAGKHPIYMPGSTRPLYDRGGCGHATAGNCGPYLVAKYWWEARQEMAAACPNNGTNCYVVAGEFTGASGPKTKAYWESYATKIGAVSGGNKPAIISFHSHHDFQPEATTGCKPGNKGACTTVAFYKWLKSRGWGDRKIWDTEAGASHYNTTDAEQKKRVEFMLDLLGDYHVKRLYYFNYFPGLATTTDRGLLNRGSNVNTAPRPAYNVIKAVTCPGTCAQTSADAFEGGAQIAEAEPDPSEPELPTEEADVKDEFSTDEVEINENELPVVETEAASGIGVVTAKLTGLVSANEEPTTFQFEYGETESYGATTASSEVAGAEDQSVSASIANLEPGTTYHFRLVANNSYGASVGEDQTFTTIASLVEPAAVRDATTGNRWVFYRGVDKAVWQWRTASNVATGWGHTRIGGTMAAGTTPSVLRSSNGTMWLHYVGSNGKIWEAVTNNNGETWPSNAMFGAGAGESAAPGTSTANVRDAATGEMWVYYTGADNAVWQWRWNNVSWTNSRVSATGTVAPGATPSVERGANNTMWLHYVGSNGKIWEAVTNNNGETWPSNAMFGAGAGESAAPGTSTANVRDAATGEMWVYYTGADNAVWQWRWNNVSWTNSRVSATGTVAPGATPSVERGANNTMWLHYVGSNGKIWEAWSNNSGSTWPSISMLGAGAGESAAPGTSPVTVRDAASGSMWVYYIGVSRWVGQWAWNGSSWVNGSVGRAAQLSSSAVALRDAASGSRWVFYAGDDNSAWQWKATGPEWTNTRIGGTMAAGTTPSVLRSSNGTMWLHYVGSNGKIWEAVTNNNGETWPSNAMFGAGAGESAAPGTSTANVRDAATGEMWVYYTGADNAVWQWRWNNVSWTNSRVSATGTVAPGATPSVERGANNTMWLHYVGSNGKIWEAVTNNNGETWPSNAMFGAGAGESAAPGTSTANVRDAATGEMWVYYTGADNAVWQWRWNNVSWTNSRVSATGTVAPGATPSVERGANNTMWLHYVGSNGKIWEAWSNNSGSTWPSISMLGAGAGESAAPGTSPVTVRDAASGSMWVYYIGVSRWVGQWAWNGSSWVNGSL